MKPKLKFLLFFILIHMIAPASARQYTLFDHPCPDKCTCTYDNEMINLIGMVCRWPSIQPEIFKTFPQNVTRSLQIHCSSTTQQSSLGSSTFKNFVELRQLTIQDCILDALPADTFTGLESIHTLYLNGIGGPELDSKLFTKTPLLENLSLARSGFKTLYPDLLCPLKKLNILLLSENQLSDIRLGIQDSDCQMENLSLLDVSWNRIRHIGSEDLKPFPNLRQLNAVGNQIDDIENSAFQSTTQIQHLYLDSNLLKTVPFLPDSITQLNLSDNRLENIPPTVANLENLASLNISFNEIDAQTQFPLFTTHLEILDLSNNRFDIIPIRIFEKSVDILRQLWMNGNQLEEIESQLFTNFTNLKTLDLSSNRLRSLSEGYFDGLSELIELRLSNNSIYHVDVEAFRPLAGRLHFLDMSGNQLTELPIAIGRLTGAKHLDFSRNQISKAYKFCLNKISHLNRLDLSNNLLESVEGYVFTDCPHLIDLNLRNNLIRELRSNAFDKCPHLKSLDLSMNQLESLNGSLRDVKSLRNLNLSRNSIKILEYKELPQNLINLSVSHNKIDLLGFVESSRIKRLELQHNQISVLLFDQLPLTLEHLNVSHNRLHQIGNDTFVNMAHLKSVDFRSNQLRSVLAQSFSPIAPTTSRVIRMFLSNNPLECSCHTEWMLNASLKNNSPLQLHDFEDVRCKSIFRQMSSDSYIRLPETDAKDFVCEYTKNTMGVCEPNCICCKFDSCDCKSTCPRGCRCFHDTQFRLNIVQCDDAEKHNETAFHSLEFFPAYATHIRLRNIPFTTITRNFFTRCRRLLDLEINGTGVRHIEPMAFNSLQTLQSLAIVNNYLHKLNGSEFNNTHAIRSLDLSNNRLNKLEADSLTEIFPRLEELRLRGNSFTDLPEVIEKWPYENLKSVYLGMNPFRCDCVTQPNRYRAQKWIRDHSEMVTDLSQVVCVENVTNALRTNDTAVFSDQLPNEGADLYVISMQEFIEQANLTYCKSREMGLFSSDPLWNNFLIVVLCIFLGILLSVTVCTGVSLIRRSRKSLKDLRYQKSKKSSALLNGIQSEGSSPQPHLLQYDAFLSFSQADSEFVQNELYHPLRSNRYSMDLLHPNINDYRNVPYAEDNIHRVSDDLINRMKSCNTLIWYLTRNFINNEWKKVENITAHKVLVQDRRHKVIVLLAPDVNTERLDTELGQMLRHSVEKIYVENHLWWNFLISALPRRHYDHSGDGTLGQDNDSETTQIYSDMYGTIVPSEVV